MTSVQSAISQIPANKLYINIAPLQSTIVDVTGAPVAWVTQVPALSTVGMVVLRDMGKTVYLPDPTVASLANGQSTILRKVQLVPSGASGVYGTGASSATDYYTGYIRLAGQTYGGGDGIPSGVARLN
jgi:hypothetical protein